MEKGAEAMSSSFYYPRDNLAQGPCVDSERPSFFSFFLTVFAMGLMNCFVVHLTKNVIVKYMI